MPFLLDAALGFVVARTSHAMRGSFRETVSNAGHDITPEEWGLLSRLWEQDGQRPAELAESTLRDRSTVTRLLDRMVEKGLARREVDPEDRRGMQTWLTPAGRALRDELVPVTEELLRRTTDGISERDLRVTVRTLRRLQSNLSRDQDSG